MEIIALGVADLPALELSVIRRREVAGISPVDLALISGFQVAVIFRLERAGIV
jgi:hypothetical protein